ncbi:hypothetical protein BD413DRAFT_170042 [Trametes elegans]|nr:hypothetical protein BD413DRAFT_170042 [Trametes elegans]
MSPIRRGKLQEKKKYITGQSRLLLSTPALLPILMQPLSTATQSSDAPSWTPLPPVSTPVGTFQVYTPSAPPPFSASASASAGVGAPSARPSGRNGPRKRYPQEVYDILTEYYTHVNTNPSKSERMMLSERIRCKPGCEDYTPDKVYAYFAGKRASASKRTRATQPARASDNPPDSSTQAARILYPSLTNDPDAFQKLNILLDDTPEPSLQTIGIWAQVIGGGVSANDIKLYADLRRAQIGSKSPTSRPPAPQRSHLLTPESSTSPEPLSSTVDAKPYKVEEDEEIKDELESEDEPEEEIPLAKKPLQTKAEPQVVERPVAHRAIPEVSLDAIEAEFCNALSAPPMLIDRAQAPKTLKELAQWLQEHEPPTAIIESVAGHLPSSAMG